MTTYTSKRKGRKLSGGRITKNRDKKLRELGRPASLTTISSDNEVRKKTVRTMGGNRKLRLYRTKNVNVLNQSTGKTSIATIDDVADNEASAEFRRRDIITKGTILKTSVGEVRVTNRPGQEGHINGVLVQE